MTATTRITGPGELIAAIPYLLGYQPTGRAVLIAVRDGRVQFSAAWALDEPAGPVLTAARREDADAVILAAYTADQAAAERLAATAPPTGVQVLDVLRVDAGRYYSLTCDNSQCCPAEGRPVPGDSLAASELVAAGCATATSRETIEAGMSSLEPVPAAVAKARRYAEISVRDRAWMDLDALAAENLNKTRAAATGYLEHARRAGTAAAPLWFLAAWGLWRLGDGARASIALDNVPDDYSAGQLLRTALAAGMNPRTTPTLRLDQDPAD